MCLEDVKLDRMLVSRVSVKTIAVAAGELVGADKSRVAVAISQPPSGTVQIGTQAALALGRGFAISASHEHLCFDLHRHGQFVTDAIHAIHSVGGITVMVVETFLKYPMEDGDLYA